MSEKRNKRNEDLNIGKNTRWDEPKVNPKAGQSIPKPPRSLTPRVKPKK
ncbi:MAG TPA: hypothetical protein VKX34_04510 [Aequorivita sp.]|nr:hypothetical protein [Aequorivita sp.]